MLRQEELGPMRETLALSLPDLATLQSRTVASDGMGGVTETWTSTANMPCRVSPIRLRQASPVGEQFRVHAGWEVVFRWDQAIASGDRVVLGSITYEVLSVEDVTSDRLLRRAELRRLD